MASGKHAVAWRQVTGLVVVLGFMGCGGLDGRKVTRADDAVGGSVGSSGSTGDGGSQTEGGSENMAGAGTEGGAPPVDGAPLVVAVTPEDAESGVDSQVRVQVRFSEALDEATVTADSVQLLLRDEPVPGTVSYDGQAATFEPAEPLALLAEYEVRVSRVVTDAGGQPLEAAFSSRFVVRDGAWTSEQPIVELAADEHWGGDIALGVDRAGNALTAWVQQGVSTAPSLLVRWHQPGAGWEAATPLYSASATTGTLMYPTVAVSPNGDAAVAWFDQTAEGYELWVARFLDGEWQRPERAEGAEGVTATSSPPGAPLVAVNDERTIVAWLRQEFVGGDVGVYYFLEANDAEHGQPFADEPQLAAGNQGGVGNFFGWADLAMDAAGNALLVFSDHENGVGTAHYSKYTASTRSWTFDLPIEGASPIRSGPFIEMSNEGTAVVVYEAGNDLSASYYTKAKGFGAPVVLDELESQPYVSQAGPIATDGQRFLVTWQQLVGSVGNTYATILTSGAWSPAELVSDGDVSGNGFPVPVADLNGNLTVVWSQAGPPNFDVYFARRPLGADAWQSPQQLSVSAPRPYSNFRAAVAPNGMIGLALSVSYQSAAANQISQPYFALFH